MSMNNHSLALMLALFLVYQLQSPLSPTARLPLARTKARTACTIEDETREISGLKCRTAGNLPDVQITEPIQPGFHQPGELARGRWLVSGRQIPLLLSLHLLYTQTSSSAL